MRHDKTHGKLLNKSALVLQLQLLVHQQALMTMIFLLKSSYQRLYWYPNSFQCTKSSWVDRIASTLHNIKRPRPIRRIILLPRSFEMLLRRIHASYYLFIITIAFVYPFSATNLSAQTFNAALYTSAEDRIFIESAPIEQLSGIIKKSYSALRGDQAMSEMMVLGNMLQSKTGFNPFDPDQMSKAGIQPKKAFAISFKNISNPVMQQPKSPNVPAKSEPNPWTMFIPARDASLLYTNLKTAFSKPEPAKLGQPQPPAPVIREIQQGKLFTVEKSNIYVARGKEFVAISNEQSRALASLAKQKQNLSQQKEFTIYRTHIARFYEKNVPAFTFYVNNKGLQEDYFSTFLGIAGKLPTENPLLAESNAQLVVSAGAVFITPEGLVMHSDALYNQGYLSNMSKLYPQLLNNPRIPTQADFCADSTAAYASFNFNIAAFKKLMEAISPDAMQKLYLENQLLKSQKNTDLIGDIFDNATGSITLISPRLPGFQEIGALEKWDLSIHIGFKPEKRELVSRTFSNFLSLLGPSSPNSKFEKISHAGKEFWSITTKTIVQKPLTPSTPSGIDKGNANPAPSHQFTTEEKISVTYLFFADSEAVISFNKDILTTIIEKKMDVSATQFPERMMGIKSEHLRNTNIVFYVRGDALINIIKDSPLMVFIAPAMPMLSKIHSLSFISRHEEDIIFTEFRLKFNGPTIDL